MTLRAAFRAQAASCAALGSPFMERLLTGLAEHWPEGGAVGRYFATFTGDLGSHGASLPLRLAGGLHALVLSGQDPDLAACYPPHACDDDSLIRAALGAMARHGDALVAWCATPPQTNEVRRSAAVIPAAHLLTQRFGLPLICSELGASGGLNLMWDRYALDLGGQRLGPDDPALTLAPECRGQTPAICTPQVAERRGVDLNPLNAHHPDDALRLRSYLWPDQAHRMALTDAAIAVQDAAVDRDDAIDWLERRLATPHPGHLHLIYHTVVWQYLPDPLQARGSALIQAAGAAATDTAPLAWLSMEGDGQAYGAALTLRIWPKGETLSLGRADFHGRWIDWQAGGG
ncbi:MAG: DUF2332 domain-containing protein [Marinibacterium sp.]|nr:DUF2332 domain-containing protein [Marinibacterium sp.]